MSKGYRSDVFTHAIFANHLTGKLGCTLQIIAGTAGNFLKHQCFGHTATQKHLQLIQHFAAGCIIFIFLRQAQGVATGTAAGNDSNLMYRISVIQEHTNDGMTTLVVSSKTFFLIADDAALALRSHDNTLSSFFHFRHIDNLFILTRGEKRSLIYQVGQICTGKARSTLGNNIKVNIIAYRLTLNVYLQNVGTTLDIRTVNHNLAVKAARTQQCRVQNIRTVCGGNHDNAFISTKAIHLYQQLVQGLLSFIVATAKSGTTLTADSINLVNKDDAGSTLFSLVKQITYAGCAYADKHLHKIGARNAEEGYACLAGNSLSQQGFTCTRRSVQKHTLRNLSTQVIILLRML